MLGITAGGFEFTARFEEDAANLTQSFLYIRFGENAAPAQLGEDVSEFI